MRSPFFKGLVPAKEGGIFAVVLSDFCIFMYSYSSISPESIKSQFSEISY